VDVNPLVLEGRKRRIIATEKHGMKTDLSEPEV
jgi:hypothetical protein